MPEIYYVQTQVGKNRVAEGYYTLQDGLVTMVFRDGEIVLSPAGEPFTHRLMDGESHRQVAGRLTKKIREVLGASNPIEYRNWGIA